MPEVNSNFMVLLLKSDNVDSIDQSRPIMLNNFLFKIIRKVLAIRLASVANKIVSENQFGFIRMRCIQERIAWVCECVNILEKKISGNIALKIDIPKTFDILNWNFLMMVLRSFGFSENFCSWVSAILNLARIFIIFNGSPVGYLSCLKGVWQGEPLSPISFSIAEDFLASIFCIKCKVKNCYLCMLVRVC